MDTDYNKFSSAPFVRANNEIIDPEETPFHKRQLPYLGYYNISSQLANNDNNNEHLNCNDYCCNIS